MSLAATPSPAPSTIAKSLLGALRFAAAEFGPLIAFLILSQIFGVKTAIAASLALIVLESGWRLWRKQRFTKIYLLTSGLTLAFGLIDLSVTNPFMLKYESVVTNIATGIFFAVGAFGKKPMIQEAAEQRGHETFENRRDVRRFFQLFTLFWAAYFFVKAAFYAYVAWTMPLTEAAVVRSVVGGISLGLMIALSVTQGRRLFFLCRWLGLLPEPEPLS